MTCERNFGIKFGPSKLRHVSGVENHQKVLLGLPDVGDGRHDDPGILLVRIRVIRIGDEYGFVRMAKVAASPSNRFSVAQVYLKAEVNDFRKIPVSFCVYLGHCVGEKSVMDGIHPSDDVGKIIFLPLEFRVDNRMFTS